MLKTSTQRQILFVLIAVAVLALLFGMWSRHNLTDMPKKSAQPLTLNSGTLFPEPRILSPFKLTASDGQPFTNDSFKGHWSLVFFGFTNCPDLCPTTLSVLNQTYKSLQTAQQDPMPQVVFISVDPEQDTNQRITEYLSSFNRNFVGATGSEQQLDRLTKEMNVLYMKVAQPNTNANGHDEHMYSIDHSGTILVINPQGQLYALFSMPHDAEKIAQDFRTITTHYSENTAS